MRTITCTRAYCGSLNDVGDRRETVECYNTRRYIRKKPEFRINILRALLFVRLYRPRDEVIHA